MAIAVTLCCSAGEKVSDASFSKLVNLAGASIGDLVLVAIAADNQGTSGANSISGVQDTQSNSYSQVFLKNQTPGSVAADGCTVALYQSVLTTALVQNTDSVQVNFSPNTTAKVFGVWKITGANTTNFGTGTNSGSGTTYSIAASSSMVSGELIFSAVANESGAAASGDTDTSNGSWTVSIQLGSGGTGGDATKMALLVQYKIVTGTGTQTVDGSTGASTDWAAGYAQYHVASSSTPLTQACSDDLNAIF